MDSLGEEKNITLSSNRKIWFDVKREIEIDIINGKYSTGEKLPSIKQFAEIYNIGVTTTQKVFDELVRDGVVYKKWGVGFFVKPYVITELLNTHKIEWERMTLNGLQYAKRIGMSEDDVIERYKKIIETVY